MWEVCRESGTMKAMSKANSEAQYDEVLEKVQQWLWKWAKVVRGISQEWMVKDASSF